MTEPKQPRHPHQGPGASFRAGASDATDPFYYINTGASWDEQQLRADYARAHQLRGAAYRADDDQMAVMLADAGRLAERWRTRDDNLAAVWEGLENAVLGWRHAPATMARLLNNLEHDAQHGRKSALPEPEVRSLYQAGGLTGHRTWLTPATMTRDASDHAPCIFGQGVGGSLAPTSSRDQSPGHAAMPSADIESAVEHAIADETPTWVPEPETDPTAPSASSQSHMECGP
ncbi:hypothetical protein [Nocardia cyriacigeorgica]|uniref:Uncharacterized protein n=1 Tax=Nocardia cyriacigeorgica TaxID=135487 RepID=A0A5R8N9X1_9NOCA|nr:hypothetical protein [Nocardia cyriacigeorgica]MBF6427858.1 hypothetical protein [Nocardia cyriacigeorgica]TLF72440.1 hypothetical protein FEK34_29240 [Nocardia cyriacigeorgica]